MIWKLCDLKDKVIWKFNWSKYLRFPGKTLISEWFEIYVIWKIKWLAISLKRSNIWMIWNLKWFENLIDPNICDFTGETLIYEWFENYVIWKIKWFENLIDPNICNFTEKP
jgi:hypothetical protein